jgi:tellurite resistance protein TerC
MDRAGIIYWPDRTAVPRLSAMKLLDSGSAGLWLAFALTVSSMLALDLGVFQRRRRAPTQAEAIAWSVVWIVLAMLFGLGVTARLGAALGAQFFTAYVVEKALSVDNLFVLMLVFARFGVQAAGQRRLLTIGVVFAIVLRTGLLLLGTAAVARFHAVTCAMGALLVVMGVRLVVGRKKDATGDATANAPDGATPARDPLPVRLLRRVAPAAGPMLLALVAVEAADLVFALDSIPAVLGVTASPFVALTSNVFAILGLRSLYFVVAGALSRLRHLETGLALVLLFVGAKMALSFAIDVPPVASLAVVAAILSAATIASLRAPSSSPSRDKEV